MISLDERYLKNSISTFIIEVDGNSRTLGLKHKDKLIVDRARDPRPADLVLLVVNNAFVMERFDPEKMPEQNHDSGNFVWGVVTTVIREFKAGR
jgi:SOS-response transcriptional repressor LexA